MSSAYYSPSTGRWLSRDPIEEEGGLNEYVSFANEPVGLIDQLGLKTLLIKAARDKTLPGPAGGFYSRKLKERIEKMAHYLELILERCVECSGKSIPRVMAIFDPGPVLPAPAVGYWTIGNTADEALMEADWNRMGAGGSVVRVFWTMKEIKDPQRGPGEGEPNGVSYPNKGIVLSFGNSGMTPELLAHEVGHYAGYTGNAPGHHSSDPNNVMYHTHLRGGLNDPDTEYCDKVISLAK
jgi:hypothetical protein